MLYFHKNAPCLFVVYTTKAIKSESGTQKLVITMLYLGNAFVSKYDSFFSSSNWLNIITSLGWRDPILKKMSTNWKLNKNWLLYKLEGSSFSSCLVGQIWFWYQNLQIKANKNVKQIISILRVLARKILKNQIYHNDHHGIVHGHPKNSSLSMI